MKSLGMRMNEGEVKVFLSDRKCQHGDLHLGIDLTSKTVPGMKDWYVTRDGPWSDFVKQCETRTRLVCEEFGIVEKEILLSREVWSLSVVVFGKERAESALWIPGHPGWITRPVVGGLNMHALIARGTELTKLCDKPEMFCWSLCCTLADEFDLREKDKIPPWLERVTKGIINDVLYQKV